MPRILLVEDDSGVRFIMEHVLFDAGHQVDAAETVGDALELLRSGSYDLVMTDARLPDGTGMEVADEAAKDGTKALIVTAHAFTLPVGTVDHYEVLLKPLRPDEIVSAVERAIGDQQGDGGA